MSLHVYPAQAPSTCTGEASGNFFGVSVAGAGDVNGDGYADVVVGAHGHATNQGKVYVYYGSSQGLSAAAPSTRTGTATAIGFGYSVAGVGDVNGDSYADVLVGTNGHASQPGSAYVYYGSPTGLSAQAPSTRTGEAAGDQFGHSVAGADDVNGDGYADVLVGATYHASQTGKAYVYYGSPAGLSAAAPSTRTGEALNDEFGVSVAGPAT